jgi:hypothetical protein
MIVAFYLAFTAYFGIATAWRLEATAVLTFAAMGLLGARVPAALIVGYPLRGTGREFAGRYAHRARPSTRSLPVGPWGCGRLPDKWRDDARLGDILDGAIRLSTRSTHRSMLEG